MTLLKIIIGFLLLLIYLGAIALWINRPEEPKIYIELSVKEKKYIEKRFKFHGITGNIGDGNREYFERDGRELKRRKITSINMTVANDGEDTIIPHYDYPVKDGHRIMIPTRFKNANPADAAIDLLIWIRKEIDP